jgi:hypothetical protein
MGIAMIVSYSFRRDAWKFKNIIQALNILSLLNYNDDFSFIANNSKTSPPAR